MGLVWPATLITTGTASPAAIPDGTTALIWYRPGSPGVSPLKSTVAGFPPIVTVTELSVLDNGAVGGAVPSGTLGVTEPKPVQ
jgi:hypothetical protein